MEKRIIKLKDTFSGSILTKEIEVTEAQIKGICKDIASGRIVLDRFERSVGIHYTYVCIGIERP